MPNTEWNCGISAGVGQLLPQWNFTRYEETEGRNKMCLLNPADWECEGATTAVSCVGNLVTSSPFSSFYVHQLVALHVCELKNFGPVT